MGPKASKAAPAAVIILSRFNCRALSIVLIPPWRLADSPEFDALI
jgi:hypothetical protein